MMDSSEARSWDIFTMSKLILIFTMSKLELLTA